SDIETEESAVVSAKPIYLAPANVKGHAGDRQIGLTSKEYALLEYFMRNVNRVLTRTLISEHVWDYEYDSLTNVVDVYVNYLRKKIDQDSDQKLIHTVRGVGYVMKEA
ncbi:MAG: DNA-binding response regulator, partial [Nitrospiraceae bacterium]|nr:DNA-binding response regulator [Nitrospiraceae bacterium]